MSLVFGVLISVILTETYFHQKYWHSIGTQFDSELGWKNKINEISWRAGKIKQTTNSKGFRSPKVNPNEDHILMVGDSIIWGSGVGDHETAAFYLDQMMQSHQVLNMGVQGYGLGQYYLNLKRHISTLKPKLVIVTIYSGNDVSNTARGEAYGKSKPVFVIKKKKLKLLNKNISKFSCSNLFARYWTLRNLFGNLKETICKTVGYKNYFDTLPVIVLLLKKIEQLAFKYDSKVLFIVSPSRDDLTHKMFLGQRKSKFQVEYYTNRYPNVLKYFKKHPSSYKGFDVVKVITAMGKSQLKNSNHRFFQKLFESQNYFYLDILKEIARDKVLPETAYSFYTDPDHYSPLGNRRFAELIYKKIKASKLL
tara:strand:+ start:385 stop:1479 length:1095 start_codon:yes stop_codon:yes gene_type:complete